MTFRAALTALRPHLRGRRRLLLAVVALSVLGAGATLAQPLATRSLLSALDGDGPVGPRVAVLAALAIAAALLTAAQQYALQRAAGGLVLSTRRRLVDHLLRIPVAEFDRRRTGDLLARVGLDTSLIQAVLTTGVLDIAAGLLVVSGAVAMMLLLDPLMFVITLVGLAGMAVGVLVMPRVRAAAERTQEHLGEMTADVERALSAVRTVKAWNAERRESAVVAASAQRAYEAGLRLAALHARLGPTVNAASQGALLLVLAVGGARVAGGQMTVGDLVAFVMFLFLLAMPVNEAIGAIAQMQTGLAALGRVEELMRLPVEARDRPTAPAPPEPDGSAIRFDRVHFAYHDAAPLLDDVDFAVPRGSRVAVVGPSGAGKSTLLALVERFYDPGSGRVLVDGVDVRHRSVKDLRRRIAYVEQDTPVLAGSLRDNLRLAAPGANDAGLLAVLGRVGLRGLAERSPLGLDAPVGDGGVLLSGGERQRLALARALLSPAPILLMDEPTSNLDARSEGAVRDAIAATATHRTVLIVAHRLSTVTDADRIVVLDSGRVIGDGPHEALVETCGLYRDLLRRQLLLPAA
ncbi:ABC transporter ATP-binding protein [Glycomyces harbinensis]|uniref:ATP-binding cassette, subfamily B/ATP-binding cassette, subfamily C n=1 Tax=Glycomyces harbinensis TaxID=58114 RepID=A0A1G6WT77_9ACTN|nr:ABC transporter ATP-binding protein [Glycomyces harbinensis]SDD69140.1 ATP-binding cassette, subfamily B/ATP-binding cassette, subfamily C [Glycomyces harbinensis]